MLLKCPECELQVSDKANNCPHCGYPMKPQSKPQKRSTRRRRLPNGFGQISEVKGQNLRNPWRAMVTVGKTSTGRPISKLLKPQAYFRTYNDAYAALVEYNKNPYDLDDDVTMYELYQRWSEEYFKTLKSMNSCRTLSSAWAYCNSIYDMRVTDVRARHLKGCIDNGEVKRKGGVKHVTPTIKTRMKSLFNLMLDYAVEYEIVERNYARTFNLSDEVYGDIAKAKRDHIIFTDGEMEKLWENVESKWPSVMLFQCYTGFRPQELGLIKLADVDLKNWTIRGGMKTPAGIDRIVPVHEKIKGLVKRYYDEAVEIHSSYLINCRDSSSPMLTYDKYKYRFHNVIMDLNLDENHRAHDPRKHFVTNCKRCGVDEYVVKLIVGHNIEDITESVYTERDVEWLRAELAKLK